MSNKTMGEMIRFLRKEQGMTQSDLAEKMNVTDKAVSKWERNLSCPDVNSIPRLAELLGVSVEELLNAQKKETRNQGMVGEKLDIALIGVGLAMGIGTVVSSILEHNEIDSSLTMLGIGLCSFGLYLLKNREHRK